MKSKLVESHIHKVDQANYDKTIGVIKNGEDNLYPETVENLIKSSPTASQCCWLYGCFLGGAGFVADLSNIDLSENDYFKYTPNHLLYDIAVSVAKHQGVFVHINYNAAYEAEDFKVIPYHFCRLGKKDDKEYNGKVAVSAQGWGRGVKKEKIDKIDVYNPHPEIIQAQVDAAGGWEHYKGQVLFFSFQPEQTYPESLLETSYLFADVEYQMGLFFNSTVRRGFNDVKLVRHKKFEEQQDADTFYNNLKGLMGIENASSVMTVEDDFDSDHQEGTIKVDSIQDNVRPDKYAHFEEASANYIRKAFKNIPPQLVDYVQGKLGNTTGEDLVKAQSIYNVYTAKDREKLEQLFSILFGIYKEDINPSGNWGINQFKLLDDGTATSI